MENHAFEYTYSARRQQEVEEIRRAYLPQQEDKLETLRRLHAVPTRRAQVVSLSVGIVGVLLLGTGMSLILTELGAALGDLAMAIGILVGVSGMAVAALAWPVFKVILKREREKIAPEILRLSDELM